MIVLEVSAERNKVPIDHLCWKKTDHMGMEEHMTTREGSVRVKVGETVGGPEGSFSSIQVSVTIEVPVQASGSSIDAAANALYDRALALVDSYIPPQYRGLLQHLNSLRGDE